MCIGNDFDAFASKNTLPSARVAIVHSFHQDLLLPSVNLRSNSDLNHRFPLGCSSRTYFLEIFFLERFQPLHERLHSEL